MNAAIPEHKPTSDEISAKDNPASAKTAAPRTLDSVRRASGLVQILIAIKILATS
jgi:hypothetical protein